MAFINRQIYSLPKDFQADLRVILGFVEDWNKNDENRKVAEAAVRVLTVLWECDKEQEKSEIIDHLTSEQEDKLKEAHAQDYHGTDDDMPDAYENWLMDLDLSTLKDILATNKVEIK